MKSFFLTTSGNTSSTTVSNGLFPFIIQSSVRALLFIIIPAICIISPLFAQNQVDTNALKPSKNELIRIAPHLRMSFHYPVKHAGQYWKPYVTGGIQIDLPTYLSGLLVRFALEAGKIDMDENDATERLESITENVKILSMSFSTSYDIPIIAGKFLLRPRLGLSNTMISTTEFEFKKIFRIFSHSENEFGFVGGIEPVVIINRFIITLPMYGEIMFSSPEPFITGNVSLTAGVIF